MFSTGKKVTRQEKGLFNKASYIFFLNRTPYMGTAYRASIPYSMRNGYLNIPNTKKYISDKLVLNSKENHIQVASSSKLATNAT